MRQSKLILNQVVTMKELQMAVNVESEVSSAVRELGYDPERQDLTIEDYGLGRYAVRFGKRYVGIWDNHHHTFVD